jgi:SAM-dependent methyltransferase
VFSIQYCGAWLESPGEEDLMPEERDINQRWTQCCVCGGHLIHYVFSLQKHRVVKCSDCGLMGINPQPNDSKLREIYAADYFLLSQRSEDDKHTRCLKNATAQHYLDLIEKYLKQAGRNLQGASLLEITMGFGDFLWAAKARGCEITEAEFSGSAIERARIHLDQSVRLIQGEMSALSPSERFDIIVFNDVLEHVRNPLQFLQIVYQSLNEDGVAFCAIPSLDSRTAELQGTGWVEFKLEHLFYFNNSTIRRLFAKTGFGDIAVFPGKKTLSLKYITAHFEAYPRRFWTALLRTVRTILPKTVMQYPVSVVASGTVLIARKQADPQRNLKITVIMAVFNEAATVRAAISKVLAIRVDHCDLDLIVVESNSSDGSREIVDEFRGDTRVNIILEDQPRGKGHAVRQGFKAATGDILLIQDADLEYDFEDYDALIEVLRDGGETFVLGSRHGGGKWKVRHFEGQPIVAFLANTVHWMLTFTINVLFKVRLTDPFTMFKVFRRSAIKGLTFECNRFDFDYELLLKLIRKGHKPVEVPVNYSARSFKEGKKVRFFKDPLTWVWAILKYRFKKI